MLLAAVAPFSFGFILAKAGATTALAVSAVLAVAGFACFVITARLTRPRSGRSARRRLAAKSDVS